MDPITIGITALTAISQILDVVNKFSSQGPGADNMEEDFHAALDVAVNVLDAAIKLKPTNELITARHVLQQVKPEVVSSYWNNIHKGITLLGKAAAAISGHAKQQFEARAATAAQQMEDALDTASGAAPKSATLGVLFPLLLLLGLATALSACAPHCGMETITTTASGQHWLIYEFPDTTTGTLRTKNVGGKFQAGRQITPAPATTTKP